MNRIMISPSVNKLEEMSKTIFFRFGDETISYFFTFVCFTGVL